MNRLTKRNGHYCDDCGYEPGEFCACNEEIAMYERLKQYEDAEEQDRLVEVRHGRWIADKEDVEWGNYLIHYRCSECKERPHFDKDKYKFILSPYCPNCGAKMDNDGTEDMTNDIS